jgi:multiple sugar transport system permease protein
MNMEPRYEDRAAWPLVLPFVGVYALLFLYPTGQMIWSSFTNGSLTLAGDWVGFANFERLIEDRGFWRAVLNTGYFALITVLPSTILGLLIAMAVERLAGWKQGFVLALFFLPYILPASVVSNFWWALFSPSSGLFSYPAELILGRKMSVFRVNAWFLPLVAFITVWWTIGFNILLFVAGLRAIPKELYEAATIDNVGRWARFTRLTLPLIWPVTALVLTIQLILQIKVFDQAYLLGTGAKQNMLLVQYIYTIAFEQNDSGYGSTVALAQFVLVSVISVLQFQFLRARSAR